MRSKPSNFSNVNLKILKYMDISILSPKIKFTDVLPIASITTSSLYATILDDLY